MKLKDDFEHQIWKILKDHQLEACPEYILAVSGGLDSLVLLEVMSVIRPQAKLKVLYYHHGDHPEQKRFRDESLEIVKQKSLQIGNAEFIFSKSATELLSEDEMRKARWHFLRQHRDQNQPILTAHHQDDRIETLTLNLIRGTAEQGLLGFQVWNQEIFRPFLHKNKYELQRYAETRNLKWSNDPSNLSMDYRRNWLRETWFKELENKIPGAYHNYSKSLLHLVDQLSHQNSFRLHFYQEKADNGLDRSWYLGLSDKEQLKALALFLKNNGTHGMTRGQLEEIKKRLDKNQNDITFEIIRKWVINATQIMLA